MPVGNKTARRDLAHTVLPGNINIGEVTYRCMTLTADSKLKITHGFEFFSSNL